MYTCCVCMESQLLTPACGRILSNLLPTCGLCHVTSAVERICVNVCACL